MHKIFIRRSILNNFTDELLNIHENGEGFYRVIDKYEPNDDLIISFESPNLVEKLVTFLEDNDGFSYSAKDVLDGVIYEIEYNDSKHWHLFCPECSGQEQIKNLGTIIDTLITKINT